MDRSCPAEGQTKLWFAAARLSAGWAENVRFTLADGRIARVEQGVSAEADDERHAAAIPGLCNVHSHAFQRGMAGLAETRGPADDDFWTWREIMYRFLDRLMPDDMEAIAALAYAEMLEGGFTRVGEFHYLHHDANGAPFANLAEMAQRIAAASVETGIGLTLLPVFYAHSDFGGAAPKSGQRRFICNTDMFARLMEQSRQAVADVQSAIVGVAPHSLRAVTPEELTRIVPLAQDGPVHIHAAEQTKEVADSIAWSGQRPVEWLLAHAQIDARWCLIHATHVNADEARRLARSGAVAGLCPITEANLGDGVFPTRAFMEAGGALGVGTDSNVLIDPAQELRALEYAQRLVLRERNVLAREAGGSTGADLFDAALQGGARALGVETGLAKGKAADIVSLDLSNTIFTGRKGDALLDAWIFATRNRVIDCVWRGGCKVVSEGKHVRAEEITARYARVLQKVLA